MTLGKQAGGGAEYLAPATYLALTTRSEVLARAARGAVDTLDSVHGAIYDALASVLGDRHADEGGAGD